MPGVDQEHVSQTSLSDSLLRVIGPLADGDLTFPFPFDLRTSAALGDNDMHAAAAVHVFMAALDLVNVRYHVTITAEAPDHPGVGAREVIDTRVDDARTLIALLGGFTAEVQRHTAAQHDTALPG